MIYLGLNISFHLLSIWPELSMLLSCFLHINSVVLFFLLSTPSIISSVTHIFLFIWWLLQRLQHSSLTYQSIMLLSTFTLFQDNTKILKYFNSTLLPPACMSWYYGSQSHMHVPQTVLICVYTLSIHINVPTNSPSVLTFIPLCIFDLPHASVTFCGIFWCPLQ